MDKRRVVWLLAAVLAVGVGGCKEDPKPEPFGKVVNVGLHTDQPGWGLFEPPNTRSGFDYDMNNWLAHELGYTPVPVDITSANREDLIGKSVVTLVVATYSITDFRLTKVGMAGPYMRTQQGVMVRNGYTGIRTAADLPGKSVCVVKGTTSEVQVKAIKGVLVTSLDGWDSCRTQLQNGQVHAVSTDQLVLYGFANRSQGKLTVIPELVFGHAEEYGIGYPRGDKQKCELLTKAIQKFIAEGDWAVFLERNTGLKGHAQAKHQPDPNNLNAC